LGKGAGTGARARQYRRVARRRHRRQDAGRRGFSEAHLALPPAVDTGIIKKIVPIQVVAAGKPLVEDRGAQAADFSVPRHPAESTKFGAERLCSSVNHSGRKNITLSGPSVGHDRPIGGASFRKKKPDARTRLKVETVGPAAPRILKMSGPPHPCRPSFAGGRDLRGRAVYTPALAGRGSDGAANGIGAPRRRGENTSDRDSIGRTFAGCISACRGGGSAGTRSAGRQPPRPCWYGRLDGTVPSSASMTPAAFGAARLHQAREEKTASALAALGPGGRFEGRIQWCLYGATRRWPARERRSNPRCWISGSSPGWKTLCLGERCSARAISPRRGLAASIGAGGPRRGGWVGGRSARS